MEIISDQNIGVTAELRFFLTFVVLTDYDMDIWGKKPLDSEIETAYDSLYACLFFQLEIKRLSIPRLKLLAHSPITADSP